MEHAPGAESDRGNQSHRHSKAGNPQRHKARRADREISDTISSLFGLNHHVIDQAQYSFLVGTVIASAVIPTMIANALFLPRHLLPHTHPQAIRTAEQPVQQATAAEEV